MILCAAMFMLGVLNLWQIFCGGATGGDRIDFLMVDLPRSLWGGQAESFFLKTFEDFGAEEEITSTSGSELEPWERSTSMTVHKSGFFDSKSFERLQSAHSFFTILLALSFKSCFVMTLIGLWMACSPSPPQTKVQTQAQAQAQTSIQTFDSKETSSGVQGSASAITSPNTVTPSNEEAKSEGEGDKDDENLVVEHYSGTRLQLSPRTCRVTAFDIRTPKQAQWTWQLEAAPGRCDFSRESTGILRMITTDKGNAISVASSKPEPDNSRWCDTKVAVLVYSPNDHGGQWSVSTEPSDMRMCAPQQWDEKMYHVMAQHTRPLH